MGMNYNSGDYDKIHQTYPLEPIFGSETSSAAADRGEYANSSVYATCYNSPEGSWQSVVQRPFISGSFTWTGFDYKGEPGAAWPCVSSRFGILDICWSAQGYVLLFQGLVGWSAAGAYFAPLELDCGSERGRMVLRQHGQCGNLFEWRQPGKTNDAGLRPPPMDRARLRREP